MVGEGAWLVMQPAVKKVAQSASILNSIEKF